MSIVMQINPFEFFTDTAGDALDSGYIYVGEANKDPRQYPVAAFYDAALTIPAPMPLRTSNGYIVRNGSPTFLYIGGNYSILVQDKQRRQIFYVPDFLMSGSGQAVNAGDLANTTDPTKGAALVGYYDRIAPAYLKTVSDILNAEPVSAMRFIPREEQAALYNGSSIIDYTANLNQAMAALISGGELTLPPVTFNTVGLQFSNARNLKITGQGWKSVIKNNSASGAHGIWVRGDTIDDRSYGLDMSCFTIQGNPSSGDGLRLDRLGWYDTGTLKASVANFDKLQIIGNGNNGIQVGRSSTEGAGNSTNITGCFISGNGRTGVVGIGQTNLIGIEDCGITLNARDGIELNQVASTNTVTKSFIADNVRYGVFAFRCEQPMITHNGFNRNGEGGVALSGDPTGSIKYTEAGLIFANLFGDNGRSAAISREVSIYSTKGTNILANYFYGTGQHTMIYLSDYAEGIMMAGNHFKGLTTEVKLEIKPLAVNLAYTFDDDVDGSAVRTITSNKLTEFIVPAFTPLQQTRGNPGDASPRFMLRGDGLMEWASGTLPSDVNLSRNVSGSLTCSGGLQAQTLMVANGIATPSAATGFGRIFIDVADGLIKIRFPSGTVKTFTVT